MIDRIFFLVFSGIMDKKLCWYSMELLKSKFVGWKYRNSLESFERNKQLMGAGL